MNKLLQLNDRFWEWVAPNHFNVFVIFVISVILLGAALGNWLVSKGY